MCVRAHVSACVRTLTSADFSTQVFALAVVTLTDFAVDAGVPRWMARTLSAQALTYKKSTDCPHNSESLRDVFHMAPVSY